MNKKLLHIALSIVVMSHPFMAHSQVDGVDSLQKKILESVEKDLAKKGVLHYNFDSADIFKGKSPVNLNLIFNELNKNLSFAKSKGDINKIKGGYYKLSTIDSMRGNYRGAYENYKLYSLYRDSLQKKETEQKEMQNEFEKKQAIAKAEQEKKDAEQKRIKNVQYFTIAGLTALVAVILLIAFLLWRNNRQKKKDNTLLQQQKEKIEAALSGLKSTQAQLIHAEKMASLGELTAGIAHEIQNPLNFVNNFSEVNKELIDELENERQKAEGTRNTAIEDELIKDIKENEQKINHHGKRADVIIKGMLQHSRSGTSQKELTDINALADEYLRLSYHGLRAKDNSFNATINTDFDGSIGKINVVPQDIGRVLLNLYNNAFYAASQPNKEGLSDHNKNASPYVTVSTKSITSPAGSRGVEIKVSDNGSGISQHILDKIFQPFFTTKPTGQGTGLGLSLSYDIIKAHGGEIKVETKENKGSTFVILLPAV